MINIDFKMAVFFAAVKHLSFTKAAQELNISQPAVSKSIHEFEIQACKTLFERNGNRLMVTEAGRIMYKYAQELHKVYEQINEDLDLLDGRISGDLRLGASTTLSNYIVPQILADFHVAYPATQIKVLHGNSQQVEQWLSEKTIDLGILEGLSNNSCLKYEAFLKDELVLVARQCNLKVKGRDFIGPKELLDLEFVIREQGSGTNDVLRKALLEVGVNWHDLNIKVILASTESIKNFLLHSDCVAYLSVYSIMKELKSGELKVVDIEGFEVKRDFFFVYPQGVIKRLPEVFYKFAKKKFSTG